MPVMVSRTEWPPPGPLSLCLAPLVYTDLAGTGGHGGEGKHADIMQKLHGLVLQLEPMLMDIMTSVAASGVKDQYLYETSVLAGDHCDHHLPAHGHHDNTPLTSLTPVPTPLPSHSLSQNYPFSNQTTSQQLSEDVSQRRGILRLCECPGVLGVCNLL